MREFIQRAAESRARELEAAAQRFRDCGVTIERFSIIERPHLMESVLCVDGVARFSWKAVHNGETLSFT